VKDSRTKNADFSLRCLRFVVTSMATLFCSLAELPAANREAIKFFETKIRPVLAANCYQCHGPEKAKEGLRLDHISNILKGGNSGPAIIAGKPEESLLIKAVGRVDPDFQMPPKQALASHEVADLELWVSMGAPWPEESVKPIDVDEHGFSAKDRQWWAVQPVKTPGVPKSKGTWAQNEIDHFISRRLQQADLKPAPEASREELVRRVYFDLLGLPPTSGQVTDFVNDPRPDAWQRLVKGLLESPRYGERWAQHWLDVVRFAESDGYREDAFRPGAYRYRDYVIKSLNDDKPYDQFVREQLAGDELAPNDPNVVIGTAFLRHGIYEWNQRNARMHWELIIDELTRVTGEVFLGVGIGCAQCHDHKFDPILQKDYYALQSFIATTEWPLESKIATPDERRAYQEKIAKWEAATKTVRDEMHAFIKTGFDGKVGYTVKQFPADIQALYHKAAKDRTPHESQLVYLVERQVKRAQDSYKAATALKSKPDKLKRYKELEAALKKFDHLKPKPLPTGLVARDIGRKATRTFIQSRSGKVEVQPAFLALLGEPAPTIKPTANSTGRRTALANWIANSKNPLSTRVIVNRVWQRHFGSGLVATPNDFGRLGELPSHPELLDWLTQRFLAGGWKLKGLHELILNSATYRQTARREPTEKENQTDFSNRLLWRFPPQRLDAEQLRDAMLTASGEMKHRTGGPSVSGSSTSRSVYVKKLRNKPDPVLAGFDAPAGFDSAPDRVPTTTPLQSLLLINGTWVNQRAAAMAKALLKGRTRLTSEDIRLTYQTVYGRDPEMVEIAAALAFIKSQSTTTTTAAPISVANKYPKETGLRPIAQYFSKTKAPLAGKNALWIQPGSRFEKLQLNDTKLTGDTFTIEAVAVLDRIYPDASVNTLVSRWQGGRGNQGWSLGITSTKSAYQPRNFIMQLVGENRDGKTVYEVVASGLRFPLGKPVYLAAVISIPVSASPENRTGGTVTFYLKDLSDPAAKLERKTVKTSIIGHLQNPSAKLLVGARDTKGHLWDGQLARLAISRGALAEKELLIQTSAPTADRFTDLSFNGSEGERPVPGAAWRRTVQTAKPSSKSLTAVTDLCHALLNSNEFLYLH
jgi:mono/diheme cytochrome c family protein